MSNKRTIWYLFEGDNLIDNFTSHNKAKRAMHEKIKESIEKSLHTHYFIKKVIELIENKEESYWKKAGFISENAYWEWFNEFADDIRHGYIG